MFMARSRSGLSEVLSSCHLFMSPYRGLLMACFSAGDAPFFVERPGSLPGAHFNGVSANLLRASEQSSRSSPGRELRRVLARLWPDAAKQRDGFAVRVHHAPVAVPA